MSLRDETNLLYEIGNIRLIPRQWARFHTPGFANLAEHHFRVEATRTRRNVRTDVLAAISIRGDVLGEGHILWHQREFKIVIGRHALGVVTSGRA